MCGRYVLYKELDEVNDFLNAIDSGKYRTPGKQGEFYLTPNYNVAPTSIMPVAFINDEGKRILEPMHWGFMGWKPKDGKKPFLPINTRDDSLTKKPMWSKAFIQRRCIVPVNGFYEWTGKKGNKTPHYIFPTEGKLMGFAGIYSNLAPDDKAAELSYSIITTSPNKVMEDIHDRMPVILHPTEFNDWLNPEHEDPNYLTEFLKPYPDDGIDEYIVSQAVGNVRNNESGLIEKADLFG
ncbi:MAG: SOS response-associated peptidase [Gracilimonas sp.]|uniref:SOS response-associated peptidase n=1 Tax=Gracilimonas sp. TaxID=1974203 RepID=UPI0019B71AC4|nr:SOS response-associated peptidase [Gracilimonas sp.]MBD3615367.1 SOS response-associated peptidase [Gracilimonas sp.]